MTLVRFDPLRELASMQDRVNRVLFACVEELAIENARLRESLVRRAER